MQRERKSRRDKFSKRVRRLFASIMIASTIMVGVIVDKVIYAEDDVDGEEDKPPDSEALLLPTEDLTSDVEASGSAVALLGTEAIQDAVIDARKRRLEEKRERAEMVRDRLEVIAEEVRLEVKRVAEEEEERLEVERKEAVRANKEREAIAKEERRKVSEAQASSTATYEATHYTAFCPTGCTGVTASGHDVSSTTVIDGYRVLAAPKSVPFGTLMSVSYVDGTSFTGIVLDRGGDIGAGRLDVLVSNRDEAYRKGRQKVSVKVLRNGW